MINDIKHYFLQKRKKYVLVLLILTILLLVALIFSLTIGTSGVSLRDTVYALIAKMGFTNHENLMVEKVLFNLRFPRTLASILTGASLAISGVLIQASTRNPLAEPFLLGLSSGALMFLSLYIVLAPAPYISASMLAIVAFIGALAAFSITLLLSEAMGGTAMSLILAGIAVSAGFSGLSQILAYVVQMKLNAPFLILLLGSFSRTLTSQVIILFLSFTVGFFAAMFLSKRLNALIFGDEHAIQLGYNPKSTRRIAIIVASLLAGVAVATSGIIGFIGLVIPHISRLIVGSDHRVVIPVSALLGGILLCISDALVRVSVTWIKFGELPVGALMSIVGAPFFAYLLLNRVKS